MSTAYSDSAVLSALRDPLALTALDVPRWDRMLRWLRGAMMLPRIAVQLREAGADQDVPERVREHLTAAAAEAAHHERTVRWEVNRIARALRHVDAKVVLLKGAAYVMAQLPTAKGRLVTDVDILVPRAKLSEVEQALQDCGWAPMKLNAYDQRYYRQWMHELPPLEHKQRHTVIDVHHTILPASGRLNPDPNKLLSAARPVDGCDLLVLAPHDMVLHSAAHLFQDGDLAGGLRDLVDLDSMMRHFAEHEPEFWDGLVPRAREMTLQRPVFYALRFSHMLLGTPIPETVIGQADAGRPLWPTPIVMDRLALRALLPDDDHKPLRGAGFACWVLYVRSHWLRMPAHLLLQHLTRKALRRWFDHEPRTQA